MNPPAQEVPDGAMQLVLAVGVGLFVVGLLLCLRRTRVGNQIFMPVFHCWRSFGAMLRLEVPEPGPRVGFDGWKMFGVAFMTIGYTAVGIVLLFIAPGWGALAFATGFVAVAAIALARAR
jgi:hypothetical protein